MIDIKCGNLQAVAFVHRSFSDLLGVYNCSFGWDPIVLSTNANVEFEGFAQMTHHGASSFWPKIWRGCGGRLA